MMVGSKKKKKKCIEEMTEEKDTVKCEVMKRRGGMEFK